MKTPHAAAVTGRALSLSLSLSLSLTLMLPAAATAATVDFDDIVLNVSGVLNVADGYQGFLWGPTLGNTRFFAIGDFIYTGAGNYANSYGSPSGENAAANYGGLVTLSRLDGGVFDFVGANFSTWTSRDALQSGSATGLTILGYNGATLVGSVSTSFSTGGYRWLNGGLNGVTSLVFEGAIGGNAVTSSFWLMDDFGYELAGSPQPVPEPSALALTALGLAALARRRSPTRLN